MSVNYEKTGTDEGILHFTVPQDEAQKAMKQAYKRIKKNISIPGFRKGHVNYNVYVKMYGEESLYQDAVNIALPDAYSNALKEVDDLDIVGQPTFEVEEMKPGKDWKLQAKIATHPTVTLGQYTDLKVSRQDREVTDDDVNERLKSAQENLAELVVKDGPAEEGDTVVIDFKGYKDGEPFEGGEADNYSLELGSNTFVEGFEDQLIGHKDGDEVDVNVTFPDDYSSEDLAGQEATFKVTVHEVKKKEVPELDDEFAKDVDDEVESLDELKDKYRQQIQEEKNQQADEAKDEEALRRAVENTQFSSVPQAMIDEEVDRQVDHYLNEMQRQGISEQLFYQITGTNRDELRRQFSTSSDERVKTNLMLDEIVKDADIQPTDEEIDEGVKTLAENYDMTEDRVKEIVTKDMLTHDLALQKAMDLVTDSAVESDDVKSPAEEAEESSNDDSSEEQDN